jgi:hypothetical protein
MRNVIKQIRRRAILLCTAASVFVLTATTLTGDQNAGAGRAGNAEAAAYPPVGTVAQLMRGIFFPNSNLIFTVQQRDPGAPPAPAASQSTPSTMFDWGQGIYTGWQVVDNAAIALADVSPLLLARDLKCENGLPAPVTDPDWIKFTQQMVTVSKQVYKIAQTRKQDAVSDATGDLSDACAACHQAYRDVRGRGRGAAAPQAGAAGANASRCLSRR